MTSSLMLIAGAALVLISQQDPPIVPQSAEGWWGIVIRNWAPLTVGLFLLRMWINREQDEKHRKAETVLLTLRKDVQDGLRDVNARIGLPEGQTVQNALNGMGLRVEPLESARREDERRFIALERAQEQFAQAMIHGSKEVGGLQALVRDMIAKSEEGTERIRADIAALKDVQSERVAKLGERVATVEKGPDLAAVVQTQMQAQTAALAELARAVRESRRDRDG